MEKIIHFETLGCRLNQDETEGAVRSFSKNGFSCHTEAVTSKTLTSEDVIFCVINTCTVTGKAEQKARRIIRLCLEKFPKSIVCVTGCYAELDEAAIKKIDCNRITVIPGTKKFILNDVAFELSKENLFTQNGFVDIKKINEFISEKNNYYSNVQISNLKFSLYTPVFEKHSRASLKIQDGCNNSCTFCRIHFARGKAISLNVEEVLKRVKELELNGKEEVVLTGVNLSQYAGDFSENGKTEKKSFAFLLKYLVENTEKIKFRVSSFYPQCVTDELCEVLKNNRVQPFFHLSIQSGSNSVLKAMARPYTKNHVVDAVKKLNLARPEMFISCDIIAGFPGETENDFNDTVSLCNECNFSWIHVFPFSARPGTSAASFKNQIEEKVKSYRAAVLGKIAVKGKINYINSIVGKCFDAVVENSRALRLRKNIEKDDEVKTYHAVTDNYIHVEFKSKELFENSRSVRLKIVRTLEENIQTGKEIEALAQIV